MKINRKRFFSILAFLLASVQVFAGIQDSLFRQVETAIAYKIAEKEKQNTALNKQGLPGNYIVYVTDEDIRWFPPNVLSLPQKSTSQSDIERLWDFTNNNYLKGLSKQLQDFSIRQHYDYYIVVCAIYNVFSLDEFTDFSNITWNTIDRIRPAKNLQPNTAKEQGINTSNYKALLQYLRRKFSENNAVLTKGKPHILHFVLTTYVPDEGATNDKPVGKLRHLQGLSYTSPQTDTAFNTVWETFYKTKQAELAGNNNAQGKKASKEEWLYSFVTDNQQMLAALRNVNPTALMAITKANELMQQLKDMPDAVMAGFSAELRIHMLQVLSGIDLDKLEAIMAEVLLHLVVISQVP